MKKFRTLTIGILILSVCCSTVRQIRPLERGQSALTVSIGGPVTKVGTSYIPLPVLTLGYNRGIIGNKLDLETGFNITQILYGILGIDAGVNYRPFMSERARPGLIITPKFFFFSDFSKKGNRMYPSLSLTPFWQVTPKVYLYTGIENWFEFHNKRGDGSEQKHHWLITPYLGIDWGRRNFIFQAEVKFYIPNLLNTSRPTKNIGFGDYGIIGGFFGFKYLFDGWKK